MNKLLSYITYIVLGVVGISILFGIWIVFPIYKGSKGDIIPLLTLFGIIFVLCYKVLPKVNRDKLKIKMNSIFYRLFTLLAPIFGKSIKTKYIRLITSICMLEEDYVIMDLTRERCVIKNIDKEKQEVFKWELYKDFKNRDAWDYQQIRITCTPLSGNCKIPITIMFDKSENQKVMFSEIMGKVVNRMNTGKDDINISKKENKERKEESASKPVKESKENIGIKNSWSLLAFAKKHGKMQVGDFANKDTGEVFKACIFTKPDGTRTFVAFAAKMGELTPKQIAEMKNELQVVQLESGNYSLCKIGTSSWVNVNLQTFDSLNKNEESPNLQKQHEGIANITDSWEIYKLIKMSDEDKCDSDKNGLSDILTDENGVQYIKKQKVKVNSNETVQPNTWTDKHGVQYDREHKLLLKAPKDIDKYIVAEGTRTIGNAAFSNCKKLKSVILPDSVIEIGHYAFAGCTSIFSFSIPNRVTKLGNGVFMDCRKLSSIRIPAGLAVVENDIFQGCDNLDSVFVPADCKYKFDELLFGHDATTYEYNHQNKSEVEVLDNILHGIVDEYGVLYDFEEQILLSATQPLRDYSVKPDTIGIRVEAFKPDIWKRKRDNSSLKRLYLPDSVTMIGDAAFANNEGLEYINIPQETVIFTDDNPFAGCVNLHTIKWDSERTVKEGTLVYNEEKTALIACLPWQYIGGVTKSWTLLDFARQHGKMQVGEFTNKETGDVFKSCIFTNTNDGTRTFVAFSPAMGELTPQEIVRQKNELIVVQLESGKYSLCKGKMSIQQESHVEVPYGIEKIAAHAFYKNDVLEIITFPPTLKAIGTNAFDGCSSLRVIYIPKGTLAKFEKIIPELRELMIERSDMLSF